MTPQERKEAIETAKEQLKIKVVTDENTGNRMGYQTLNLGDAASAIEALLEQKEEDERLLGEIE